MLTVHDLLARGYFPKELPPAFSTKMLAEAWSGLPTSSHAASRCVRYSFSKYASVRRTLAIPNPAHFIELAKQTAANWVDLVQHCGSSPISRTKPRLDQARAISWESSLDTMPELRASSRAGARFVLQADIANCYSSFYTHSIPWGLHTKSVAKRDRSHKSSAGGGPPLAGNVLDFVSRNIQGGQTLGLPVGPDTSIPLAEIVLTEVDKIVEERLRCAGRAFRFVDDYEVGFETYSEAETGLSVLQDALGEYELQLNARKTRIVELPHPLDTPWVQELSAFQIDSRKPSLLRSQTIRYFSKAFELAKSFPAEPVLKYAVLRASQVEFFEIAPLAQQLLFQAAALDPSTLQTALYVAADQRSRGATMAIPEITRALGLIIRRHAGLQHGGDVAWALWGAAVLGLTLPEEVAASVEKLTDPVAVLMSMYVETKRVFARALDRTMWQQLAAAAELYDSHWLIAYEGCGQGWLPHIPDAALTDSFFNALRMAGVFFMDTSALLTIPAPPARDLYE